MFRARNTASAYIVPHESARGNTTPSNRYPAVTFACCGTACTAAIAETAAPLTTGQRRVIPLREPPIDCAPWAGRRPGRVDPASERSPVGGASAPPSPGAFTRYWAAAAISSFGTAVTAVAMPVLVIQLLGATPFEVGLVNAAQFVPYALLGVIAGVYTDRWHRKPILVWASLGRAVSLAAIPVLWLSGALQVWMLLVALLLFGGFRCGTIPPAVDRSAFATALRQRSTGSDGCRSADCGTDSRRRTRRPARGPGHDHHRLGQLSRRCGPHRDHPRGRASTTPRSVEPSGRDRRRDALDVSPPHARPVDGVHSRLVRRQRCSDDGAVTARPSTARPVGLLVGVVGERPTLVAVIIVFAVAALIAALSPLHAASRGPRDDKGG